MPDLTDWLAEQHAADERVALAAENARTERGLGAATPWIAAGSLLLAAQPDGSHDAVAEVVDYQVDAVVEHVARHDPQSVLARIEAERMLTAMHRRDGYGDHEFCVVCADTIDFGGDRDGEWPCPTLRALAWGYRHRDGYRAEEWAPEGVAVVTTSPAQVVGYTAWDENGSRTEFWGRDGV